MSESISPSSSRDFLDLLPEVRPVAELPVVLRVPVVPVDPLLDPESPIPEVSLAAPVLPAPAPVVPAEEPVPVFILPGPSLLEEPFAFPDPEDPPFSFRVSIVSLLNLVNN